MAMGKELTTIPASHKYFMECVALIDAHECVRMAHEFLTTKAPMAAAAHMRIAMKRLAETFETLIRNHE